jgi:hypothetical protein
MRITSDAAEWDGNAKHVSRPLRSRRQDAKKYKIHKTISVLLGDFAAQAKRA